MARRKLRPGELGRITTTKLDRDKVSRKYWYRARGRVGTAAGGTKQIQATALGEDTTIELLHQQAKETAHHRPGDALGSDTTISELVDFYIPATAKRSRPTTPQTRDLYRRVIRVHLPTGLDGNGIGHLRLGDLPSRDQVVRAWLEEKHSEVPSTAKTLRSVLMGAFKWCEGRGVSYWDRNPAGGADIAVPVAKKQHLDASGIRELRRRSEQWQGDTRPTPVTTILDVLAATGVRIGEVLALRWEDIDLDAGTVTIAGTVVDRDGKKSEGGGTQRQDHGKSDKAFRTLTLPGWIIPVLMERRVNADNNLVFPNAWGGLLGPNGFRRKFREIRGEDMKWVTPKSYRAAVATIIAEEGDDAAAARQLGHESAAVTNRHYIKKADVAGDNTAALEKLNPRKS